MFERLQLLLDRIFFCMFVRGTEMITELLKICNDFDQRVFYVVDSIL